jgi:hypothetical protein
MLHARATLLAVAAIAQVCACASLLLLLLLHSMLLVLQALPLLCQPCHCIKRQQHPRPVVEAVKLRHHSIQHHH